MLVFRFVSMLTWVLSGVRMLRGVIPAKSLSPVIILRRDNMEIIPKLWSRNGMGSWFGCIYVKLRTDTLECRTVEIRYAALCRFCGGYCHVAACNATLQTGSQFLETSAHFRRHPWCTECCEYQGICLFVCLLVCSFLNNSHAYRQSKLWTVAQHEYNGWGHATDVITNKPPRIPKHRLLKQKKLRKM